MDRKEQNRVKREFELHVGLIMRVHDVTKSVAQVIAYSEGPTGLLNRLIAP